MVWSVRDRAQIGKGKQVASVFGPGFCRVVPGGESCPWSEPSGWGAVEAAEAVEAARREVREAQDRQHGAGRRLAARVMQAADGWLMPAFPGTPCSAGSAE